ncbi:MAG: serine hydrolase [Anaerolineae bacterium]|nr:serine hydrolase [Anaerolineae bacterium]
MASTMQLKRSTPEAEGIPSAAVLEFVQALEQHTHPLDAVQGLMLLRHGHVVAEGWWAPYGPRLAHSLYSLSKSFTSSAIGLAVAEGLLTVDDPVLTFFPDDAPADPSENLKAMRVRHLLSMNTGHQQDTTGQVFRNPHQPSLFGMEARPRANTGGRAPGEEDDNWPRAFLSLPVEHRPGTWFVYNTAATYMLSAIITKLTGMSLLDYLRPRLFEPLGIENPTWETGPRGINLGGTGLHIKTEDIARFGQMYLQQGVWNGKRILAADWIAEATRATSDNSNTQSNPDWTAGYGYQFWRCRHDCYRGDGAFGQYCVVMPEQDAVLAMNGGLRDMQAVLDKVWEHLLPAMGPEALPADLQAHGALRDKLATLSLPLPEGQPSSPVAAQWDGKPFMLESNDLQLESVAIRFGDRHNALVVRGPGGEHAIEVGYGTWLKGTADDSIAACGAWTAENRYEVRICNYEGVFCQVLRLHYTAGGLQLEVDPNASRGPTTVRTIAGRAAG